MMTKEYRQKFPNTPMSLPHSMNKETKRKLSRAIKKKYDEDPSYRDRVAEATKEAMQKILNDPAFRNEYLERQRLAHDLEVRKRQAETLRKNLSDPIKRKESSQVHLELFRDSEYRKHYDEGRKKMKMNEEWRKNLSLGHMGKEPWNRGKAMPNEVKDKLREARLSQVMPKVDTSIEIKVQEILEKRNIKFETHYPVIGQPDIAFPDKKIAVFCDGCYWHGCINCGYDLAYPNHDEQVNMKLENQGWTVLRFWEHEINENTEECVNQIEEVINSA